MTINKFQKIHTGEHITVYRDTKTILVYSKVQDKTTEIQQIKNKNIAAWGENNLLPQKREDLLKDNNIVPELIATKRGIILGQGLQAYKIKYVEEKIKKIPIPLPLQIQEYLDQVDFDNYLLIAAGELLKHSNLFVEMIFSKSGKRITNFKAHYTKYIRAGEQDKSGKVPVYYYCGDWGEQILKNEANPKPIQALNLEKKQTNAMLHVGDPLFWDGYYYYPAYWGGKEWIELSNAIPKFHKSNLQNGYSIRFHIKIPVDYFLDKVKWDSAQSEEERKKCITDATAAETEFISKMNKFLAGLDNAGRAVYTKYMPAIEQMMKENPGIQIIPLNVDLKDDALLKLFEKSNDANISAQGIHPSLASIQTQGKLSAGAEIRNALLAYIAIKTPIYRSIILKPLYIAKKMNEWPKDLFFTFEDIEITKLDENKSGQQNKIAGAKI